MALHCGASAGRPEQSAQGAGCVASIGVCSSQSCIGDDEFATGNGRNLYFQWLGGMDESAYWDAYYDGGDNMSCRGRSAPQWPR